MPCYAPNKISYSKAETAFIKAYYRKIPNTDILKQVNTMRKVPVNMSSLRHYMRRLKLIKGVRLINWTAGQQEYLVANYKTMGNIELAKKITRLKLSSRKFNKKHIEKKMNLLGLQRTAADLLYIKEKHKEAGHYPGRVHSAPDGHVVIRIISNIPHPHIKIKGMYTKQARVVWQSVFGDIPAGHIIAFRDSDSMNLDPDNLYLLKTGSLTFQDKVKMLRIARFNIESLKAKPAPAPKEEPKPAKATHTISVSIKPGLTLQVKPGTDIPALIEKYKNREQEAKKSESRTNAMRAQNAAMRDFA